MNHGKLGTKIYKIAKEKGWWDQKRSSDTIFMLILTELAEAIEADRKDAWISVGDFDKYREECNNISGGEYQYKDIFEKYVKDTVEDEIADAYIRCLDYLAWKHGEYINIPSLKKSDWKGVFADDVFYICRELTDYHIKEVVAYIELFAEEYGMDLEWHVKEKMRYNGMRSHKHGNKKY